MESDAAPGQDAEHVVELDEQATLRAPEEPDEGTHGEPGIGPDLDPTHADPAADLESCRRRRNDAQPASTEKRETPQYPTRMSRPRQGRTRRGGAGGPESGGSSPAVLHPRPVDCVPSRIGASAAWRSSATRVAASFGVSYTSSGPTPNPSSSEAETP